jgi:hypothetical protein
MQPDIIAGVVAGAISIALEVVPGLREVWQGVGRRWKPAVVLALSLGVPLVATWAACRGIDIGLGALCQDPGSPQVWVDAVRLGFVAFLASQVTFHAVSEPLGRRMIGSGPIFEA